MLRTKLVAALVLSTIGAWSAGQAMAQQEIDGPSDQKPAFLQPPPRELLQRGLQPLDAELPDSRVPKGLLPPDASEGVFGESWASPGTNRGEQWTPIGVHWAASGNRYRPTYFEDTMLERHGQARHPLVQPLASGTRFFMTIPALPYGAVVNSPHRPISTLGHFRAGSGAPCLLQRPPLQADAGLFQAGLVVGLIFIVP